MKISHNWLLDFIQTNLSTSELSALLTDIGLEVEGVETIGISKEDLANFYVGEVVSCEQHPNADKLKVTQINFGNDELVQIVCGAPNVAIGQKVPVARPGAKIKDGKGGEFEIKKAKLRGEESNGMICSKKELRLSDDHSGIWAMDENLIPGTPLSDVISGYNDEVYEIGLTPNRADAMSHFGVARDLFATLKSRKIEVEKKSVQTPEIQANNQENPIEVFIENPELCLRYTGIYLKNIQVKESPTWIQDRLRAIGLSPINNVVDITNYVLHTFGQPMHAFDADKIEGNKILVKTWNSEVELQTLDKVERKLNGTELLITDTQKPLGIAGVMGGLGSAVQENTTNIFLESAYFQPVSVRKTSKALGINSDSSFRFERGIDPNFTAEALKYAVSLLQEYAGAEIVGNLIDLYPTPIEDFHATLKFEKVNQLLGEELPKEKIIDILNLLDIKILHESPQELDLQIPSYRVDVQREADLIEEILRIYGFNNIATLDKISMSIVSGNGFADDKIDNTLAEMLVDNGFSEVINISLQKEKYNQWLGIDAENTVHLLNSLSADLSVMRRNMLPGLLENIDFNIKRKRENIKIFEFGKTYTKAAKGYSEKKWLSIAVSGNQHADHWNSKKEKVDFYYLKGVVEQLLSKFNFKSLSIENAVEAFENQGVNYLHNQQKLLKISEINSSTLKKFDIQTAVFYAEIDLELFRQIYLENHNTKMKPLSKFPRVQRDLALLLDKDKTYQSIEKVVLETDNQYIKNVNLFDVYEGDKLPEGKKSYAISIDFEDTEKTMNEKQIENLVQNVISRLQNELNAELRK